MTLLDTIGNLSISTVIQMASWKRPSASPRWSVISSKLILDRLKRWDAPSLKFLVLYIGSAFDVGPSFCCIGVGYEVAKKPIPAHTQRYVPSNSNKPIVHANSIQLVMNHCYCNYKSLFGFWISPTERFHVVSHVLFFSTMPTTQGEKMIDGWIDLVKKQPLGIAHLRQYLVPTQVSDGEWMPADSLLHLMHNFDYLSNFAVHAL